MSKVICDICGTSYPESEDFCPICGCSQDVSADMDMELQDEDFLEDSPITAVRKQKESAAQEEQERLAAQEKTEQEEEEEDEEEEEEGSRGTGVVILLVILIMLLLAAAGFLFLRYLLPNLDRDKAPQQTKPTVSQQLPTETTEPGIPCQKLILTSGGAMDLTREGEYKLIHVLAKPEDTTDTITYTSSDETIVTVTEQGRMTAVAEGEATVTITCGDQSVQCRVYVRFVEETEPPTEEATEPTQAEAEPEETAAQTEPEETVATEAATAPTEPEATGEQLKDVTLKLGKSEFILPPGYTYTVPLDCDLSYEEIEWSTEHPYIASVKNGVVSGISNGVTVLTARYGDQEVTCIVRIKKI